MATEHTSSTSIPPTPTASERFLQGSNVSSSQKENNPGDEEAGICRVCGDKSKAFHYGVLTCEGCKSFFSRALVNHSSYTCPSKNCIVVKDTRNRCMYCRWVKCLSVGMSKDSSKLGRRSRDFKATIAASKSPSDANYETTRGPKVPAFAPQYEGSTATAYPNVAADISRISPSAEVSSSLPPDLNNLKITPPVGSTDFGISNPSGMEFETLDSLRQDAFRTGEALVPVSVISSTHGTLPPPSRVKEEVVPPGMTPSCGELTGELIGDELLVSVAKECFSSYQQAFVFECCHGYPSGPILTRDNILSGHFIRFSPSTSAADNMKSSIIQRMTGIIERVVKFCKKVPGFRNLSLHDQMLILKGAAFEIVALQTASVIDLTNQTLTLLGDPHCLVPFEMLKLTPLGTTLEEFSHVGQKLNDLQIRPVELSLLCGLVLLSPGRPGLEQRDVVEKQQYLLSKALRHQLRHTHPTNYDDVHTGLMLLMPYIREINCKHSSIILDFNKVEPDTLPPLHQEVFRDP